MVFFAVYPLVYSLQCATPSAPSKFELFVKKKKLVQLFIFVKAHLTAKQHNNQQSEKYLAAFKWPLLCSLNETIL